VTYFVTSFTMPNPQKRHASHRSAVNDVGAPSGISLA